MPSDELIALRGDHQPGDTWLSSRNNKPVMFTLTWDNILIAWSTCSVCVQHMIHCVHDLPVEPDWLKREHTAPSERSQTTVYSPKSSTDSYKILGSASRQKGPISISDFVDDDLVAKVKKAKEDRDAGGQ